MTNKQLDKYRKKGLAVLVELAETTTFDRQIRLDAATQLANIYAQIDFTDEELVVGKLGESLNDPDE